MIKEASWAINVYRNRSIIEQKNLNDWFLRKEGKITLIRQQKRKSKYKNQFLYKTNTIDSSITD